MQLDTTREASGIRLPFQSQPSDTSTTAIIARSCPQAAHSKYMPLGVISPGTKPRTEAPISVGRRIVWQSCQSSGNGSKTAAGPAVEAATVAGGAAARMHGKMNGMVNMPKMFELTVSSSARETLAPSCWHHQHTRTADKHCLWPSQEEEHRRCEGAPEKTQGAAGWHHRSNGT